MANDNKGLTPMMRQFFEMKAKHPEALLLFRCGDFYETYCEDAIEASRILGITLTRRNNGGSAGGAEMAGFPHHALDTYLPKLVRAGKRVLSLPPFLPAARSSAISCSTKLRPEPFTRSSSLIISSIEIK